MAWKSYKQIHYPNNFIRNNLLRYVSKPKTSKELAQIFNRKQATLQEVLSILKAERKIINYKCRSNDYWVRSDSNTIIISTRKAEILNILKRPHKVSEISKNLKVTWKPVKRRLEEMQRLGLVKEKDYLWMRVPTTKEVVAL